MSHSNGAPLVSVIIPAYNVSTFIAETLASVFAQRFADFEVIVVNDGSPDTPALEAAIEPFRDRIDYLSQANGGPSAARNTAILRARGTYLAFLDGDDQWLPDCLGGQVARISADPRRAVVYGDARIIGNSVNAGKSLMQLSPSTGEANFVTLLTQRCAIVTSCAMVRRDACVAAGMFDPAIRYSEDFDLWLRIAHAGGRFAYTREILGLYRRHDGNASANIMTMADAVLTVLDKAERELPLTHDERAALEGARSKQRALKHFLAGKQAFVNGDFTEARSCLREANSVMRSPKLSLVVRWLAVSPRSLQQIYRLTTGRH